MSIIYLIFIRLCAGIFVWLVIFIYFACLGGLGACFYLNIGIDESVGEVSGDDRKNIAYVFWGVAGVSFLVFLCFFSRIRLAVAILKTGANFIGQVWSSLFVPVGTVIPYIFFLGLYLIGFVIIYTADWPNTTTEGIKYGVTTFSNSEMDMRL